MGNGGWTPGKVILVILGAMAGLAVICCAAGWFLMGDKVKSGFRFAADVASFTQEMQKEFGEGSAVSFNQNDKLEYVLLVGLPGELSPERVTEAQDKAWKAYATTFAKNGGFPVKQVAVGRPVKQKGNQGGLVRDWSANQVSVEEVVRRTGVAEPPIVAFIPEDVEGDGNLNLRIQVGGDSEEPEKEDGTGGDSGK